MYTQYEVIETLEAVKMSFIKFSKIAIIVLFPPAP